MKTCSKCGVPKEETDFYKKTGNLDGLSGTCRGCCNAYGKANHIKRKIDRAEQTRDFLLRKAKV